ncbi:MAG TPA: VCBS repeat-containing protein, partial [Cyclobacteriaceae bacterium]|nr:VCBS repeat-containing protein [Cyclobacteriaceae bacterium]
IDRDGDQDLFISGRHVPWSYPDPESCAMLINKGGRFEDATKTIAPELIGIGMVNDAKWADFNNDGLVDLVLAGEWMPLTLFLNAGGQFKNVTAEYGLSGRIGWWFSIEAADMDNDGDQDLIAGNFGLNSAYGGTMEAPLEIYYNDFDVNGLKDIVFAINESGRKFPLARKKDASAQVAFINDKFPNFTSYAKADIYEIYGKENLGMALHYSANTFASMYLENTGNGKFLFHELPKLAQISSINDILIDDFNSDKNLDLLVAGNLYSVETSFPRNDAGYGLLLEGDGKGQFRPVDRMQSGFFVPYDVKSMTMLNMNDEKYVLVGCNNDSLRVFKWNK